jgi:uncharacterized protein YqhQ
MKKLYISFFVTMTIFCIVFVFYKELIYAKMTDAVKSHDTETMIRLFSFFLLMIFLHFDFFSKSRKIYFFHRYINTIEHLKNQC